MDAKRIETIEKLIAKANDPACTEAEAQAFNDKIAALMIKWEISDAMLNKNEKLKTDVIISKTFTVKGPKIYTYELASLGCWVADAMGCQGFISRRAGNVYDVGVVGFSNDVERVAMLVESLALQAVQAQAVFSRTLPYWYSPSEKFNEKRSFIKGFGSRVAARIKDTRRTVIADETIERGVSTDLVLVDKAKQVENWMKQNMTLGDARTRKYTYGGASAGRTAANTANIGQTSVSKGNTQALGN